MHKVLGGRVLDEEDFFFVLLGDFYGVWVGDAGVEMVFFGCLRYLNLRSCILFDLSLN